MRMSFLCRMLPLLLLCVAWPAWAQESVTFRFAPREKLVTVSTSTSTTEMNGEVQETKVEQEKTRVVTRRTATGFTQTTTLVSASVKVDGEAVEVDTITRLFQGVAISIDTDPTGKVKAIRGIDTVLARVKEVLDADDQRLLKKMLSEKALRTMISEAWQSEYGHLIGRTVKVGDTWTTTSTVPLPSGKTTKETTVTTMSGFTTVDGVRCAVLKTSTTVDLKMLSTVFTDGLRSVLGDDLPSGMKPPTVTVKSYTELGERLVDPNTLETLRESSSTIIRSTVFFPGLGEIEMVDKESSESKMDVETVWRANLGAGE